MSIDDLNRELEQRLRSSLHRQADAPSEHGHGADLADVFGRARRIRRRRTALVASAAAVAVVAVAVPAGVLLAGRDTSAPPHPVSTVSTVPTPAPTQTVSGAGLGGITMGAPTTLTYLDPTNVMHNGQPLPDRAAGGDLAHTAVSAFTPYHGGWLITYDTDRLVQVDAGGHVVRQGKGGTIVTTSDGMQTAWQIGQKVYAGIASGMSDGEASWQLTPSDGLVGYLSDGPVISDGSGYAVLTGPSSRHEVASDITPSAVSQAADAVGGVVGTVAKSDQQGALADAKSGTIYWRGAWRPMAFSPDGKYVGAIPVEDNGDPSAIAILDAHTGTVIARTPDLSSQIYLGKNMAWDGDRLVFDVAPADGQDEQALVSIDTHGRLEQVSPTVSNPNMDAFSGAAGFIFMTR